jgi:hypothetical protein
MFNFIENFLLCFHPKYWIMNKSYNKAWDKELEDALSKYKFEHVYYYASNEIGMCEVMLGPHKLWVANHPYGSFIDINKNVRASRRVVRKAGKMLSESTHLDFDRLDNSVPGGKGDVAVQCKIDVARIKEIQAILKKYEN